MRTILAIARYTFVFGAITAAPVFGQFTQISMPDAAYTSSTTLVPIAEAIGATNVSLIASGPQMITLSTGLNVGQVGVSGWSTWSSPPNSETATPKVLVRYSNLGSLSLTLSAPASTFGFEFEPNTFAVFPISVAFMNGATTLGTVTQSVNGSAGARLFAATSATPITSVVITPSGGNGFAIAQFRYAASGTPTSTAPVPSATTTSLLIGFASLIGVGLFQVLRSRRITGEGL